MTCLLLPVTPKKLDGMCQPLLALLLALSPKAVVTSKLVSLRKHIDQETFQAIQLLQAQNSQQQITPGHYKLLSCEPLVKNFKQLKTPIDDVQVLYDDSTNGLTLNLELVVMGANIGLSVDGSLDKAAPGQVNLRLNKSSAKFYEPCEEFGVSRQIASAQERLGGLFSGEYAAAFGLVFADEELVLLRCSSDKWLCVLSRVVGSAAAEALSSRVYESAQSSGLRGRLAFDEMGGYLGETN